MLPVSLDCPFQDEDKTKLKRQSQMYNLETLTTEDEDKTKLKRQSQMYNPETLTTQNEDKRKLCIKDDSSKYFAVKMIYRWIL
jgi:hypothetical protein